MPSVPIWSAQFTDWGHSHGTGGTDAVQFAGRLCQLAAGWWNNGKETNHIPALAGGVRGGCHRQLGAGHHGASHYSVQIQGEEGCGHDQCPLVHCSYSPLLWLHYAVGYGVQSVYEAKNRT